MCEASCWKRGEEQRQQQQAHTHRLAIKRKHSDKDRRQQESKTHRAETSFCTAEDARRNTGKLSRHREHASEAPLRCRPTRPPLNTPQTTTTATARVSPQLNSMPSACSTPTWRAYKRTAIDPAMARFCADYIW